jgi:uncharacterized membrane protein
MKLSRNGLEALIYRFKRLRNTPYFNITALLIALVYTLITIGITIQIHNNYRTSAFDLGCFEQSLKYTLQGKILWYPSLGVTDLAHHFSPVLLFLVPIYAIFPHPQTLLIVQAIALGFSGYIVYCLAKERQYRHQSRLLFEGLFFVNPLLWGVALFDFHPIAFVVPALLIAFLGLTRNNKALFGIGLFFSLICREDATVAIGVFGLVLVASAYWKKRKVDRHGIIIFVSAVVIYIIAVVVSAATSKGEFPRILTYFTNRYTYLGQPPIITILGITQIIFSSGSLFLIVAYFAPLGFTPLLSFTWCIPALFVLASGILSTQDGQHTQLMHYPATAIPFLFMAFIESLPRLQDDNFVKSLIRKTQGRIKIYAICLMMIASFSIISVGQIQFAFTQDKHLYAINQIVAAVPDGVTVTATNRIFPHLCSRTETYLPRWTGKETGIIFGIWGFPDKETEYVIVDRNYPQIYYGTFWESATKNDLEEKYSLVLDIDGAQLYRLKELG